MPSDSKDPQLAAFLHQAEARQIPHATLIGLLTSQGWSEKEAYAALAGHYRAQGLDLPTRPAASASAREAFFYLLLFSTLATWAISFYLLASALIDRWLPDPLFNGFRQSFDNETVTDSLAALIVAYPLYLLIGRALARESAAHPEKLDSAVRKWLTYLALVVAACVFMGDLIAALAFLLRGEITSRFLAKSAVVLALSGGVFLHYFGGLRKTDTNAPQRDRLATLTSAIAIAVIVILGFLNLGTPSLQRDYRADTQRTQHLHRISQLVFVFYRSHNSQLPATLAQLPGAIPTDPLTQAPYLYQSRQGSQYELCATFNRPTPPSTQPQSWPHPAGPHCFPLDATAQPEFPTPYLGN